MADLAYELYGDRSKAYLIARQVDGGWYTGKLVTIDVKKSLATDTGMGVAAWQSELQHDYLGGYGDQAQVTEAIAQYESQFGALFPGNDPISGGVGMGGETTMMTSPTGAEVVAPTTASAEQLSPEDLHYADTSSAGQLPSMETPPLGLESGLPEMPIMDGRPVSEADRTAYRPAASSRTGLRTQAGAAPYQSPDLPGFLTPQDYQRGPNEIPKTPGARPVAGETDATAELGATTGLENLTTQEMSKYEQIAAEAGFGSVKEMQMYAMRVWDIAEAIALDNNFPPMTPEIAQDLGFDSETMVMMNYKYDAEKGMWVPQEATEETTTTTGGDGGRGYYSSNYRPRGRGSSRPGYVKNPYVYGGWSTASSSLVNTRGRSFSD